MKDKSRLYGRFFDDFKIGDIFYHDLKKTITESDNNLFSLLTMNHHPVHLDFDYSNKSKHGQILIVGTLVFSITVGITVSDISGKAIANLGYDKVKHLNPVFIGDTISVMTEVLNIRTSNSNPYNGIVSVLTTAFNQNKKAILSFERSILIPKAKNNA